MSDSNFHISKLLKRKSAGFTLLELLVVIGIIALLSAIVVGMITDSKERARIKAGMQFDSSVNSALGANMLAQWRFDENSGNLVKDNSGHNLDGTYKGTGGSSWVDGIYGKAFKQTCKGYFLVSDTQNLMDIPANKDFVVTAWVKSEKNNSEDFFQIILMNGTWNNNKGFLVHLSTEGAFVAGLGATSNSHVALTETVDRYLRDGKWHHVATEFIQSEKKIKIYVDGIQKTLKKRLSCGTMISGDTYGYSGCSADSNNNVPGGWRQGVSLMGFDESNNGGTYSCGAGTWGNLIGLTDQVSVYEGRIRN